MEVMTALTARLQLMRRHWSGRRELGLFASAYLTYFGVRAVTQGDRIEAVRNAYDVVHFERVLQLNWERPVQNLVIGSRTLVDVANGIYIWGHWPVLVVGGILLYHLSRRHYYRLRNVCLLSGAIGFAIFALFPLAPPRLAGFGLVDTVTTGAHAYRTVLPTSIVNEYAAMPSFHAGWNLLLGIALFQASRHLLVRAFAILMPAAMGFAVIATANHYVVDVAAGCGIVLLSLLIVDRVHAAPTIPRDVAEGAVPRGTSRGQRVDAAPPRRAVAGTAGRG
jgi:hypothetical protein